VNKREDAYGGSVENRCRFALEVLAGISEEIGETRIGIRLSPYGSFQCSVDTNPVALFTYLLRQLSQRHPNLAYIHLGDFGAGTTPEEREAMVDLRKEWTGKCMVNIAGMTRAEAIEYVESGRVDLIAFARNFLANPDLPERLKKDLPLNRPDYSTMYTPEETGYTDYSFYNPITA